MSDKHRIQVLYIDDSALIHSTPKEIVNSQPDVEMVGVAPDPIIARDFIKQTNPGVLTLNVGMPKIDGLDFLEELVCLRPAPVVMIPSLMGRGSKATLRALEPGAMDFVAEPRLGIRDDMNEYVNQIADKTCATVCAKLRPRTPVPVSVAGAVAASAPGAHVCTDRAAATLATARAHFSSAEKLIIVGTSTSGIKAVKDFLMEVPPDRPSIPIIQHMPAGFITPFAKQLDGLRRIRVGEAAHDERVLPGHAYIAPGDIHLSLGRSGANYVAELDQGPSVNHHRPATDVLSRSAMHNAGTSVLGVILTGMGKDGAMGMLEMCNAGACNVTQSEASCVVYDISKEAVTYGGVHEVLPLSQISLRVLAKLSVHGHVMRVQRPVLRVH